MASAKPETFLEKHLSCPICMEMFTDPRALPCLHTFCLPCLHSYIGSLKPTENTYFECPVCRAKTSPPAAGISNKTWAERFPSNYTVKALVEEHGITANVIVKQKKTNSKEVKPYRCDQHPKKRADFFCSHHTVIVCSMCVAHHHRKCEHVIFLAPDSTDNDSQAHRPLSRLGLSSDKTSLKNNPKASDGVVSNDVLSRGKTLGHISGAAASRNNGNPVISASNNTTMMKSLSDTSSKRKLKRLCDDLKAGPIDDMSNSREKHVFSAAGTGADLAASTNGKSSRSQEDHTMTEAKVPYVQDASPIEHTYSFSVLNDILEEDRSDMSHERKATVPSSQLKLQDEFYVRIQEDKKCCSITAIACMVNGDILLADEINENLKLFNRSGEYISHLALASAPWDVTSVQEYEAAVTLPTKTCIQLVLVNGHDDMSIIRQISVDKQCYGISFVNRLLYVAMDNEIRILTYEGNVVKKIGRSSSRKLLFMMTSTKPLFDGARHLVIDRHNKHPVVYVSCIASNNSSLIAVDRKGSVMSVVKTGGSGKMYGVSVCTDGRILVCQSSKTLVMVSIDKHGSRSKEILEVENLQTACFDETFAKVYISRRSNGFIRVYTF